LNLVTSLAQWKDVEKQFCFINYHWNTSVSPHPQRRRPGVTQTMVNDHLKMPKKKPRNTSSV